MFKESLAEFKKTRSLAGIALCLALSVVLSLPVIKVSNILQITFAFISLSLCGYLYGPVAGCVVGALTDVLAFVIRPTGTYFPGFTLSCALTGLIFGIFLYKHNEVWRVIVAKSIINLGINLFLNNLWLKILLGKGFWASFWVRLAKNTILLPVEILIIIAVIRLAQYFKQKQ